MVAYTERMLEGWRDGEHRDIHRDMMRLTLEIVAKTLVDTDITDEAEDVGEALGVVMAHFSDQGNGVFLRMLPESVPTPSNLRYRRAQHRLEEFIYGIIDERRKSGRDTGDLLSMLLHARDEDGSRMSDDQLRDEVMTVNHGRPRDHRHSPEVQDPNLQRSTRHPSALHYPAPEKRNTNGAPETLAARKEPRGRTSKEPFSGKKVSV